MAQARQTKQSLDNIIAENERLRRDLASEIAKFKQMVRQASERPPRADDRLSLARQQETDGRYASTDHLEELAKDERL